MESTVNLGHSVVCQIKSDRKVGINNIMNFQVREMAVSAGPNLTPRADPILTP